MELACLFLNTLNTENNMGKQNNTDNKLWDGIIIIMGVIFLVLALATLLAPIVVLILFLINWIRYLVQDRKGRATNFWLSESEQEEYKKTVIILARAEDEKRKVQDSVNAHGISRNQDGQISQRSYVGKGLRERENNAKSLINEYTPVYKELQFRPYTRWKKARSHYSKTFGFGFIILVIVAMFGIVQLGDALENKPLASIFRSVDVDSTKVVEQLKVTEQGEKAEKAEDQAENSSEMGGLEIYGLSIGIMAGFLVVLVIIWLIGWLIGRIRFGLKNPEPPLVSMDNLDTYIKNFMEDSTAKEVERQQRKEKLREKREQKRIVKEKTKEERIRLAEKKSEEAETQNIERTTLDILVAGDGIAAHEAMENNVHQRSKEENLFISWANCLRNEGYNVIGNWDNWENSGLWKNLAVVSSLNGVNIRIIVEYYVKSNRIYFGISKLNDEEKVSQELLNSETFQNIIAENRLTIKNNEWWYCLKFSTFDKVFQEYHHLIKTIN